jgi:hypothetical protein
LHAEEQASPSGEGDNERATVTFGIGASDEMNPVNNISGWRVSVLSKTYHRVAQGAGLLKRGEFRVSRRLAFIQVLLVYLHYSVLHNKFDSEHDPMYVCYPEDGFGLDGVNSLLKLLRK